MLSITESNSSFLGEIVKRFPDVQLSLVVGIKDMTPKLYTKLTKQETIMLLENILTHLKNKP